MTICAAADPASLAALLEKKAAASGTERPVSTPGVT
jgi:hypothetical protein